MKRTSTLNSNNEKLVQKYSTVWYNYHVTTVVGQRKKENKQCFHVSYKVNRDEYFLQLFIFSFFLGGGSSDIQCKDSKM